MGFVVIVEGEFSYLLVVGVDSFWPFCARFGGKLLATRFKSFKETVLSKEDKYEG